MATLLERTRAYLEDPKHWTKGEMFRDRFGSACKREDAVCACLLGAVAIAGKGMTNPDYRAARGALPDDVTVINDDPNTTHADVLALLDKVIAS